MPGLKVYKDCLSLYHLEDILNRPFPGPPPRQPIHSLTFVLSSLSIFQSFKMPSLASLTALVAAFGLVTASPVALEKRKTFTLNQVAKNTYVKNGAASIAKTYEKFGKSVPANILAAAAQQGTVAANPEDEDVSYLCPVTVGTTTMDLDFDTGSADL